MKISLVLVFALVSSAMFVSAQEQSAPAAGATAKVNLPPAPTAPVPPEPAKSESSSPVNPGPPATTTPSASTAQAASTGPAGSPPPTPATATAPAPAAPKQSQSAAAGAPATGPKPYVIGPLDVLIVRIWNLEKLSGPFTVGADGMLTMPLVGAMKADGLTTKQLTDVLTQRLKECCVNNPEGEVDVQLGKNNSKRYYVYGGVGRPGEYPLDRSDLTIMDAMASVGGIRDFANKKKIYLLRGTQKFNFNYTEVMQGKHLEQNIVIQNGDRLFVPE